jgi:iron complex transport system substrate-binding protein
MMVRYLALLLAAALALSGPAALAGDASRIVSIGGAVTEILYALGAHKNIVGIDSTSVYPPRALTEKPNVGYMRQLSAEGVLGLRPSLILASEGSGPRETLAVLKAAQVPITIVPDVFSGDGILEKVRVVANAVGATERGGCIIDAVRADLQQLGKLRSKVARPKRIMFVLSIVGGRAMVSGNHTAADGIIAMAGGVNAVADYEGYKTLTDEAIIAARPDIVLTIERGGPNPVGAQELFALPAFSATPAAAKSGFIAMDGLYLLGFGPRTARAARDLTLKLYPELAGSVTDTAAKTCPD